MQHRTQAERAAETSATAAIIKHAIHDQACLSGTYAAYRMRFAPHILGRDDQGNQVVVGFDCSDGDWMRLVVHRLRGVERNLDRWRGGLAASRPQLAQIEASVDDTSARADKRTTR